MKKIVTLCIIIFCSLFIVVSAQTSKKTKPVLTQKPKLIVGGELGAAGNTRLRKDINQPLDVPIPPKQIVQTEQSEQPKVQSAVPNLYEIKKTTGK